MGQGPKNCVSAMVKHHYITVLSWTTYLKLHPGSPPAVQIANFQFICSSNGHKLCINGCMSKRRLPIFSPHIFWQTWLLSHCGTKTGQFLTWACSAVTLLTLRLGSSRYGNGDGECVLSQQQADKACGVWREPASGTSPWRYTHTGPRLILLPPACRSAPARSPTGAHPKPECYELQKILQTHSVCGIFFLT